MRGALHYYLARPADGGGREEVWRSKGERLARTGLRGMTGSAFEAMDVVVAKQIVNREEVRRSDSP